MKRHFIRMMAGLGFFGALCAIQSFCFAEGTAAQPVKKVGIYDSRAIAVAYAGSAVHEKSMAPIKAQYSKAKQEGNTEEMKRINAEMRERQKKFHAQGFSTASVDDILKQIPESITRVKAQAGVDAIVSKWDEAALKPYAGAEKVDVTMLLVDEFHPSERQRRSAVEIQKTKPISLKEAAEIND